MSWADARSGEQVQTPDLAPQTVQTNHFEPYARVPGVNNNPWEPELADVVIDENGITINNGKLYLNDLSGASVLGPAGFEGSWAQFLASGGVYNSEFSAGTVGALVTTEQGLGGTTADYQGSLSEQLPYWIVSVVNGTLSLVADTNASYGRAVESAATAAGQVNSLYQDIAVQPGQELSVSARYLITVASGTLTQEVYASYRDSDHGLIGAKTLVFGDTYAVGGPYPYPFDPYEYDHRMSISEVLGAVPANAAYVRVEFEITHNVTTGQTWRLGSVGLRESVQRGELSYIDEMYPKYLQATEQVDVLDLLKVGGSGIMFGNSFGRGDYTGDVTLSRSAAGVLNVMGWKTSGGGTSFPASPAVGDMFYRTDLGEWCRWDGSYWLGEIRTAYTNISGATATTSSAFLSTLRPGMSIRYVRWWTSSLVITTNDASNYWTLYHVTMNNSGSIGLYHNSRSTAADGTSGYVKYESASTDAVSAAAYQATGLYAVKTGAPGALYVNAGFEYCPIYT